MIERKDGESLDLDGFSGAFPSFPKPLRLPLSDCSVMAQSNISRILRLLYNTFFVRDERPTSAYGLSYSSALIAKVMASIWVAERDPYKDGSKSQNQRDIITQSIISIALGFAAFLAFCVSDF